VKKVIKHPDGRVETVEGTADEIAEYERKLREVVGKSKSKKPVLHGAEIDGQPLTDAEAILVRLHRAGLLQQKEQVLVPYVPYTQPYLWQPAKDACRWCGAQDCQQMHIICDEPTFTLSYQPGSSHLTCSSTEFQKTVGSALRAFEYLARPHGYAGMDVSGWVPPWNESSKTEIS
jgi:hypothetical protein